MIYVTDVALWRRNQTTRSDRDSPMTWWAMPSLPRGLVPWRRGCGVRPIAAMSAKGAGGVGSAGGRCSAPALAATASPPFGITSRPGDQLDHLDDDSVDVVVIDPPYEANVMYAELSEFFYMIHLSIERLEALG